ncbi:MAG: hypothetical protein ACI9UN_003452 [Granulosicoccus sp.]|jgi:hypothetical protein
MYISTQFDNALPDAKYCYLNRIWWLGLSLLALSVFSQAHAEQRPINCALPHTDTRISECTVVKSASEYPGCLNANDITEHTCIVMDTDLTFCPDQASVAITAIFDRSERTLDCNNGVIARQMCVPFEISTDGLGPTASALLDGIVFSNNSIDSARPPRLRNLSPHVTIVD